jgi:hypothetical protein
MWKLLLLLFSLKSLIFVLRTYHEIENDHKTSTTANDVFGIFDIETGAIRTSVNFRVLFVEK